MLGCCHHYLLRWYRLFSCHGKLVMLTPTAQCPAYPQCRQWWSCAWGERDCFFTITVVGTASQRSADATVTIVDHGIVHAETVCWCYWCQHSSAGCSTSVLKQVICGGLLLAPLKSQNSEQWHVLSCLGEIGWNIKHQLIVIGFAQTKYLLQEHPHQLTMTATNWNHFHCNRWNSC